MAAAHLQVSKGDKAKAAVNLEDDEDDKQVTPFCFLLLSYLCFTVLKSLHLLHHLLPKPQVRRSMQLQIVNQIMMMPLFLGKIYNQFLIFNFFFGSNDNLCTLVLQGTALKMPVTKSLPPPQMF